MFKIKMAGMIPEIDNQNSHVKEYCESRITDMPPCFRVKVSHAEIESYMHSCKIDGIDEGVAERILICRKIAAKMAMYDRFLLHSAVIDYDKNGIAFVADRGVGKTTHMLLWKECFNDKVRFVNGDKPIIRKSGDEYVAYNTPWCGKEGFGDKKATSLKAVVFLERADVPKVIRLDPKDAVPVIAKQTVYPEDASAYGKFAEMLAEFTKNVPMYLACVNMRKDSAECVRNYIFKDIGINI